MKVTFLGTGTSQGVPVIACSCMVCASTDPRDNRLRSSILVEWEHGKLVIDTGPDFRYQMLRAQVKRLDAILFTHGHKDHVAGLDDVRAYNYQSQKPMAVYADAATIDTIKNEFSYIFNNVFYPGIPKLQIRPILPQEDFNVNELRITPICVLHYKMPVLGFRLGDFTYITDANFISADEIEKIKGSKVLVLNALRHEKHISHFTLNEAMALAKEIGAEQTYFTHISHQLGTHEEVSKMYLCQGLSLAYDGLVINV